MSLVAIVLAAFIPQIGIQYLLCAEDTGEHDRPASFLWWRWDNGVKIMTVTNNSALLP